MTAERFSDTLPPKGLLKRLERRIGGAAPAEIRRRQQLVRREDGPWGAWAPTPGQARLIALARRSPAFRATLRIHAALWLDRLRAGPVDERFHGLAIRFYPMLAASFRHMLLTPSAYQRGERGFLSRHGGGAGVFVDIGANAGVYALWAAATWPDRPVIAFEPLALHAEILARNLAMAGAAERARVIRALCGGADGTAAFSPSAQSMAYGTDTEPTPCRSLLSVLNEHGATAVAALKIDAEGVEDRILAPFLRDAPPALLPRAVLIEHAGRHLWQEDAVALLEGRGYRAVFRSKLNTGFIHAGG